jgi:hypothetical protein
MTTGKLFTAAQVARAAGVSRQAVHARMKNGTAWSFFDLPKDWQEELTRRGVKRRFENGEAFLAGLPEPWKCPVPWTDLPEKHQIKALNLQKALARALELRGGSETGSDVEAAGLEDFHRLFGYSITGRHWRRLFQRTIERDGGADEWQHEEIYLDERAFITPSPARGIEREFLHRELDDAFETLKDRQRPTAEDREFLWDQAFCHFRDLTTDLKPRDRSAAKRSIVRYLLKGVRALAETEKSLLRRFEEKWAQWRTGGELPSAIRDRRRANSGRPGKKLCEKCRPLMIGASVDLDGDFAQAWRRLHVTKAFCYDCRAHWTFNPRTHKSYVPKCVIHDIRPDVESALPWRRGPKFVKLNSPAVRRDWSDTGPGDSTVCNDATPDHAIMGRVELPLTFAQDAKHGLFIGRLEVLFAFDERTEYPLAWVAIVGDPALADVPQGKAHYNQVHQRLLFLRQHDRVGFPHKQWKMENGPWRNRLNDGDAVNEWERIGFASFANGLAEATGRRVRHADPGNPRTKIVERIFGVVWNRMKCHSSYLGNNERTDRREVIQDFIARAKAGNEDARNELLPVSDFTKILDAELMAFANEAQNGQRLPGCSPVEAWLNGIDGHPGYKAKPLEQLGPSVRFLLSTHERLIKVKPEGIVIRIGRTPYNFWGPELEQYQNAQLLCRFNFEEPEFLSCSPASGKPFIIRARTMPANTASKEQLTETARARASWKRRGKVIYDSLLHPFKFTISRDSDCNADARQFGADYTGELEKHKKEKATEHRKIGSLRRNAAAAGLPSDIVDRHPERAQQYLEMQRRAAEIERQEAHESN